MRNQSSHTAIFCHAGQFRCSLLSPDHTINFFHFTHVNICLQWMHTTTWNLQKPEKGTGFPGTGSTDSCELQCWCWEQKPRSFIRAASALSRPPSTQCNTSIHLSSVTHGPSLPPPRLIRAPTISAPPMLTSLHACLLTPLAPKLHSTSGLPLLFTAVALVSKQSRLFNKLLNK